MVTLSITGNHGLLKVNAATGEVVSLIRFEGSEEYAGITAFDLAEWATHWDASPAGCSLDILDVGYWDRGEYVAPEADWRNAVRYAREARRAVRGSPVLTIKAA